MKKKSKCALVIVIVLVIMAVLAVAFCHHFPEETEEIKDFLFNREETTTDVEESDSGTVIKTADDNTSSEESDADSEDTSKSEASSVDMSQLMEMYAASMAEPEPVGELDLPVNSSMMSLTLAKQALTLCTGSSKSGQATLLMNNGFEILLQDGYDKSDESEQHTCAFTVARKTVEYGGELKPLLLIAIRGTNAGEWFSNFNFADSESNSAEYAENFLEASQSIYLKLVPILLDNPDALILACGHSRGAAAANLLGMTLDDRRGYDGVFVYTFATPNTYRGTDKDGLYTNIFNFINPADVVTEVPLKQMGFHHIGVDVVLPCEPETSERIASEMDVMYQAAPTIKKYYTERHSLTGSGLDKNGYTGYEIMQALASSMTGIRSDVNGGLNMKDIYKIMEGSKTSTESDFAPLIDLLQKVIPKEGTFNGSVLMQHMPMVYQGLIDAYEQIYASMMSGALDMSGLYDMQQMPEGSDADN